MALMLRTNTDNARAIFRDVTAIDHALRMAQPAEADLDLWPGVRDRLQREPVSDRLQRKVMKHLTPTHVTPVQVHLVQACAAPAALLLLAIGGLGWWGWAGSWHAGSIVAPAAGVMVTVQTGEVTASHRGRLTAGIIATVSAAAELRLAAAAAHA